MPAGTDIKTVPGWQLQICENQEASVRRTAHRVREKMDFL